MSIVDIAEPHMGISTFLYNNVVFDLYVVTFVSFRKFISHKLVITF